MLLLASSEEGRRIEKLNTGPTFSAAQAEAGILRFITALDARPASVGLAIPGIIDEQGRVAACGGLPHLEGWQPRRSLSLPCVVRALNDAEAALIEEVSTFNERIAHAAIIMAGTDIGAAFLTEGRILRGARGWAGELGSIPFKSSEGYRALDAFAGGGAILRRCEASAEQVAVRVEQGDAETLRVIREAGEALGAGLAAVINLFNPELLVLAGGALCWPGYYQAALAAARSLSLPQLWESCAIRRSAHGELLVALGAARAAGEYATETQMRREE